MKNAAEDVNYEITLHNESVSVVLTSFTFHSSEPRMMMITKKWLRWVLVGLARIKLFDACLWMLHCMSQGTTV